MKRLFVPGVFDVFHVGHLNYLKSAAEAGDYIIVGVQDDRSVLASKNVDPIIPLTDRIAIIESLRFVNEAISYTSVFQGPLLAGLDIDVFAVGEEYGQSDLYPGQKATIQYCLDNDIEVYRIPRTERVSSTQVRGQLRTFWNSRAQLQRELSGGVTVLGSFKGDQQKVDQQTQVEVEAILNASGDTKTTQTKSLLDLGCGDGRQLVPLCAHFDRVVGVDYASSLLEITQQRLDAAGHHATLVEADVSEFLTDDSFDVLLLSGIIPCLDDDQMHRLVQNLRRMAKPESRLLVRSSIALNKRINVVNQFSEDLKERYTAYYRTTDEINAAFSESGWGNLRSRSLYQHREDTAVWWFEYYNQAASELRVNRAA